MVAVKVPRPGPFPAGVEPHVVALIGRLLEVTRQTLLAHDRSGLRPSHFRLLSHVPAGGVTHGELAAMLSMTKQGVGQFVAHLEGTGHLAVTVDDADRRRRPVTRTARGDRLVADVNRTLEGLEQHWAQRVGPERYRVFREVLHELADAPERPEG
jgi:DNA-binding MarR family transcriptional regulator